MSLGSLKRHFFIFSFLQGFLIWYAIDKLYFQQKGISLQQIVMLGILAQAPQFIFEVPSSVLADRWSRKGVLVISEVGLILSSLILGLGSSYVVFIIGVIVWSLGSAMYSGTFEALLFDSLKHHNQEGAYQKIKGRCGSLHYVSMFLSGFAALGIAQQGNLRLAFILTIPVVVVNTFILLRIPEPPISRTSHNNLGWARHMGEVLKAIKGDLLRWLALLSMMIYALQSLLYEYYQLIGADKGLSTQLITIMFSAIVIAMALSAEVFSRVKLSCIMIMTIWLLFGLSSTLGLLSSNSLMVFIDVFILFGCLHFIELYVELEVQNNIESSKRATILSTLSGLGQIIFLGMALIFSLVIATLGVSGAVSLLTVPLLGLGAVEVFRSHARRSNKGAVDGPA